LLSLAFADMGTFQAGGIDSLSAVELSNSLGTSFAVPLPSTLVFDYPSSQAMAQYIHSVLGPKASADSSETPSLVLASEGDLLSPQKHVSMRTEDTTKGLVGIIIASRSPGSGHCAGDACFDAVQLVPFNRWDLDAVWVR
jgi:hypothetical protein